MAHSTPQGILDDVAMVSCVTHFLVGLLLIIDVFAFFFLVAIKSHIFLMSLFVFRFSMKKPKSS